MTFAHPRRVGLLGLLCGLSVGCGDEAAPLGDAGGGSGGMSSSGGGSSSGGSAGNPTGGSAGSAAQAGGSVGGASGGAAGGGAGGGGTGGMAIDPNGGAAPGPASGRHTARPSSSMPGTSAGYYEYVPPHYGNGALYPLLVFRHGVGENGSGTLPELDKVLVHGPPKLIEADEWPEARPFVVLSVQHTGAGCPSAQELDDFFAFALENYDIDAKRVYLTGLSCGAIGSWSYMGEHTDELIAAAVPICGDARSAFQTAGCNLNRIPIWAFHGDMDMSVTLDKAQVPIEALQDCTDPAPTDLTLTIFPGVGHDSWTMTYKSDTHDIYAWLLSHSKP